MERIRVCFPFIGDYVGGSHLSALGLIRHLDRRRFEPLIVLHRTVGPLADLLRREGIPFAPAPAANELDLAAPHNAAAIYHVLSAARRLVRFVRRQDIDIVHTNDGRIHLTWGLAGRLAGAKVLWHHRSDPNSFGLRHVAPIIANRIAAVSRFASPRPGFLSAARKSSVVFSPFDLSLVGKFDRGACRTQLLQELGFPPETRVVGYAGQLIARKRPVLFVDAIAAIRRQAPQMEVVGVLLGEAFDGLDESVKARAAELGISDKVHLLGFRYPGEPWLAALDLLLVTAVDEPLGRTLVEAMLLGTPVIAASSGGNLEAIRDRETGILVPADDPEAFAAAALEVLSDPNRAQSIVQAGRRDACARFGIDKHVDSISLIYEDLVKGAGRPARPWK